ncbi:hypothetical protein Tco_1420397 [Tanacetum coccineum]
MMGIEIQQDVPLVQSEPFHEVKVSVIPEPIQQPLSTPPLSSIEDPAAPELKQDDQSATILESIRSQVPSAVKEYLRTILPDAFQKTVSNEVKNQLSKIPAKAVSDFATLMKKSQSYRTADQHKILYDRLVNSYLLDKDLFESYGQIVSLKRNREKDKDEDPSAEPNQCKETKKRRTGKEAQSLKKSSTPKESTKGKPPSKSSKSGRSASADQ